MQWVGIGCVLGEATFINVMHQQKIPRLITIPISHYCEKVRWALERLKLPYIEEPHVPLFHWLATYPRSGKSVPLLVTKDGTFTDSTDILQYLDKISPVSATLYPTAPDLRREVEQLEDLFDTQLAPSVRDWAYFYLFNNWDLMKRLWCYGTPLVEQALFPIVFPLIREAAIQTYKITAESATKSYNTIKSIFETVNEMLADGRSYLVDDKFSCADMTFASLAAPVVLAAGYRGVRLPYLNEVPDKMAAEIKELQETPAGIYALRLYDKERVVL